MDCLDIKAFDEKKGIGEQQLTQEGRGGAGCVNPSFLEEYPGASSEYPGIGIEMVVIGRYSDIGQEKEEYNP